MKKILYLGIYDKTKLPGVYNKISETLNAAREIGYIAHCLFIPFQGLKNQFKLCSCIIRSNADIYIVRSLGASTFVFLPLFILARLQGKIIIYDIPTPMKASYVEFMSSEVSKAKKLKYKLLYVLNGPWSYWAFNKILQYGEESFYYRIFNNRRLCILGNGIDENRFQLRKVAYSEPSSKLKLIAVANITTFQGFERIVKAVIKWNINPNKSFDIELNIVGDGPDLINLKELAQQSSQSNKIKFHGHQGREYIANMYSVCHLAIGTLGLYKLGLKMASVLKIREYCLAGIPFIASADDPDFPGSLPFRFEVGNNEGIDDILKVFEEFPIKFKYINNEEIRQYAIDNLSYKSKLKKIGL